MYPDHIQKWSDFGHGLWIFIARVPLWLSETGQIYISKNFLENMWEHMFKGGGWKHISNTLCRVLSRCQKTKKIFYQYVENAEIKKNLVPQL